MKDSVASLATLSIQIADISHMNTPIKLADIISISNPSAYKLHLACRNSCGIHPLDEYIADRNKWIGWNEYRREKNDWTRQYVFSFIEFYPLRNAYLFGGVFEVMERHPDRYEVLEVDEFKKWEGRLICCYHRSRGMMGRAFNLEKQIGLFDVNQILPEKYNGKRFCGFEQVSSETL